MAEQFSGRVDFGLTPEPDQLAQLDGGGGITVTAWIDGDTADIRVGGNAGQSGDVRIYSATEQLRPSIHLDGAAGDVIVTGDVKLIGGDCAEEFEIVDEDFYPGIAGDVVCLNDSRKLRLCTVPYDKKVVGVVSGAATLRPGIILGRKEGNAAKAPVALVGTVYCKVDARTVPVEIGDLLTTSGLRGHAMKADDPAAAFGATLGKSLGSLKTGTGLVPILVTLR